MARPARDLAQLLEDAAEQLTLADQWSAEQPPLEDLAGWRCPCEYVTSQDHRPGCVIYDLRAAAWELRQPEPLGQVLRRALAS